MQTESKYNMYFLFQMDKCSLGRMATIFKKQGVD